MNIREMKKDKYEQLILNDFVMLLTKATYRFSDYERGSISMKWYVCFGVICILLAVCSYNMYNRYEQEDIEIETVLIKMSEENERKKGRNLITIT